MSTVLGDNYRVLFDFSTSWHSPQLKQGDSRFVHRCHCWSYMMSPSVSVRACPALPRFTYAKSRKPSFRIFFAALTSRSCSVPHCGHTHLRTDRSFVPSFRYPHAEHSWLDG